MGGCGKHMMHPYDDLDLTFGELINFIKLAGAGSLKACEKIDGVNVHWRKDYIGQHLFALNMGDMKKGGITLTELRYRLQDHPARNQFLAGCITIVNQTKDMNCFRDYLFPRWINTEIVSKDHPQCIRYDRNCLVFHDLVYYNESTKSAISCLNENVSKIEWENFTRWHCDTLETDAKWEHRWYMYHKLPVKDYNTNCKEYLEEIKNIMEEYYLDDFSTLRDYYSLITIRECNKWLSTEFAAKVAANVWDNGKWKIREIRKHLPESYDKNRFNRISLSKNRQGYRGECKTRMRNLFDKFGAALVSHLPSNLISDSKKERERLEEQIRFNIIQAGEIHIKEYRNLWVELKDNLDRFESLQVDCPIMEGIVVDYNQRKYKLTGAFPSMNRCCGTVRYALGIDFDTEKEATFANAY